MSDIPKEVHEMELYAWVGRDGDIGLKLGMVPAGMIPMVSTSRRKLDGYWKQAEQQAKTYGQRIYLVRMTVAEVVRETKHGKR